MEASNNIPSIVFLGPSYPYRGGIASFTERLAREFKGSGYRTSLYTFSLQYPSFLFPGKTQFSSASAPTDLNIKPVVNSINPFNWIKVGLKIKKEKPDYLVVRFWLPFMGPCFGTILRLVSQNNHTKIICIADNIIPHEKRMGDKLLTSYFIKPIHAFIAMSDQVMNDMDSLQIKQKKQLLPHPVFDHFGNQVGMEDARKELNIPSSGKIILFFGFIRNYKGLDILLEAMAKPNIVKEDIKLLVAGEFYEDEKKYTDLIHSLKLTDKVLLHNHFIAEEKIKYYFSAADVLVQPYRHATQSGVTPLAFHFNLPMIVTNVGGLKEMVVEGKTGIVTEPNADSIANGINEYFQHGKNAYTENLKEHKNQYSWAFMAKGIIQLADEVTI